MLNNCCFCINLKTATLTLSVLGAFTHLYVAFTLTALSDLIEDADIGSTLGITLYFYITGFACLAGTMGVLKNNVKQLRIFDVYYWADLVLHTIFSIASAYILFDLHSDICKEIVSEATDEEFDMDACDALYLRSASVVIVAMVVNMLLKLHFAFAIHAYTNQVDRELKDEEMMDRVIVVKPMYVAGKEFIPDEKQ